MKLQEMLKDLSKIGLTDEFIGHEINAPQSLVNRLRNGVHKSTSYERGLKISELWHSKKTEIESKNN
jgi:predicted transcriptional regulator